jgi:hypothetical protein
LRKADWPRTAEIALEDHGLLPCELGVKDVERRLVVERKRSAVEICQANWHEQSIDDQSLQWYIVGAYSAITAAASNSGSQVAREALRTVSLSMCSPGTTMHSLAPRFIASRNARTASVSGTNHVADGSLEREAGVIASRYTNCMLSLPLVGGLLNICDAPCPTGASGGK